MVMVHAFGRKSQPQGYSAAYPGYKQAYIIAVTGGELLIDHQGIRESVTAGMALVLAPGCDIALSTPNKGYRGHFVDLVPTSVTLAPHATVLGGDQHLRRIVDDIEAEYQQVWSRSAVPELSLILALRCLRRVEVRQTGAADLCQHIQALLQAHLFTADPLAVILGDLPCSYRQAERIFRRHRGTSIKQAQLDLKCRTAKALLLTSDLSITAIAMDLGFPSSQHFATQFRRIEGCTPSRVRSG